MILNIKTYRGEPLEQDSSLNIVICHKNVLPKFDHFISIVIKNDLKYYCDDSQVLLGLPRNTSMNSIKSKCYLLFYQKVSQENVKDQYLEIPYWDPPRKLSSKLNPLHHQIEPENELFPVTSKRGNNTKEIVVSTGKKIGDKEISLSIDNKNDELYKYQELDHSCRKRVNLHDEFKYIWLP